MLTITELITLFLGLLTLAILIVTATAIEERHR